VRLLLFTLLLSVGACAQVDSPLVDIEGRPVSERELAIVEVQQHFADSKSLRAKVDCMPFRSWFLCGAVLEDPEALRWAILITYVCYPSSPCQGYDALFIPNELNLDPVARALQELH